MDPVNKLLDSGDPFEKEIFKDVFFRENFKEYAIFWYKYILPNRSIESPEFTIDEYQNLAQCHYSIIIRIWCTKNAIDRIRHICQDSPVLYDNNYKEMLQLQSCMFDFFCHCGAVIDNFDKVFTSSPILNPNAFNDIKQRCDSSKKNLDWFYDRRTQYVHKSIIPIRISNDGIAEIIENALEYKDYHWNVNNGKYTCISGLFEKLWLDFIDNTKPVWSELLALAKEKITVKKEPIVRIGEGNRTILKPNTQNIHNSQSNSSGIGPSGTFNF